MENERADLKCISHGRYYCPWEPDYYEVETSKWLLDGYNNPRWSKSRNFDGLVVQVLTQEKMPYAGSDYQFYQNVLDFGAPRDSVTDDTIAINRAVA